MWRSEEELRKKNVCISISFYFFDIVISFVDVDGFCSTSFDMSTTLFDVSAFDWKQKFDVFCDFSSIEILFLCASKKTKLRATQLPVVYLSSSVLMIKRIPNHQSSPNQTILMQSLHLENRLLSEYRRHSPHSPRITMGKMTSDGLKKGKKKIIFEDRHSSLFAAFFICNWKQPFL